MGGVNLNIWTLTDNLCWRTLYLHIRVKCQFLELICIVSGRVQWNVLRTGNVAIKTRLKTRFFFNCRNRNAKKKEEKSVSFRIWLFQTFQLLQSISSSPGCLLTAPNPYSLWQFLYIITDEFWLFWPNKSQNFNFFFLPNKSQNLAKKILLVNQLLKLLWNG